MSGFRFTRQAASDLEDIQDYIAPKNLAAAIRVVRQIEERCRMLGNFPGMGSSCEDLAPGMRKSPVGNYMIFFRPAADGIEIVRVLHGARDFPSVFAS
jgi:toxin ParE1/3/4